VSHRAGHSAAPQPPAGAKQHVGSQLPAPELHAGVKPSAASKPQLADEPNVPPPTQGGLTPSAGRRPAFVSGVILRLTIRATVGRRRALIFATAPVIMIGVSALLRLTGRSTVWPPEFLGVFGFTVVLPLTALIIGTSVLGAEIDDGTIVQLLATPVRRRPVVLSKFLAAALPTIVFGAIPLYLAGAVAPGPASRLALGLLAGAVAASAVYNALFVLLSVLSSRAIAFGLL